MTSTHTARVIAGAALVIALGGCGSSGERASSAKDPAGGCTGLADAGTTPRTRIRSLDVMYLTGVKLSTDGCADRVTFTLESPEGADEPGFRIGYASAADAQTEDGSGRHVPVAGTAFLVVRLEPAATAKVAGEALDFTYTGSRRLTLPGARAVREVVKTGDFEAVVHWTIGLDRKRPFRVVSSSSPPRLTVEVG